MSFSLFLSKLSDEEKQKHNENCDVTGPVHIIVKLDAPVPIEQCHCHHHLVHRQRAVKPRDHVSNDLRNTSIVSASYNSNFARALYTYLQFWFISAHQKKVK